MMLGIPGLAVKKNHKLINIKQWLCQELQVYPEFFDVMKLYFEKNPKLFAKTMYKVILRIYPFKT